MSARAFIAIALFLLLPATAFARTAFVHDECGKYLDLRYEDKPTLADRVELVAEGTNTVVLEIPREVLAKQQAEMLASQKLQEKALSDALKAKDEVQLRLDKIGWFGQAVGQHGAIFMVLLLFGPVALLWHRWCFRAIRTRAAKEGLDLPSWGWTFLPWIGWKKTAKVVDSAADDKPATEKSADTPATDASADQPPAGS